MPGRVGDVELEEIVDKSMDTNNFLKDSFFKNLKTAYKRCWAPEGNCDAKPIKAHSIQNSRVLEMLNLNGHVIMPQEKFVRGDEIPIPIVGLTEVGRNEATTFIGLCRKHDNDIFSPIEDFDINLNDEKQLFLIAYRSVIKKFHSLVLNAVKLKKIYEDQVKVGRATHDENDLSLTLVTGQNIKAFETYLYKRKYDEVYIAKHYSNVQHQTFSFKHQKPTLAVSGFYGLETIKSNNYGIPWIALNVFPTSTETHVIFSYLAEDLEYVSSEIESIFNSSIKRRLWLLSEKIIRFSENFVLSPIFWNNLSNRKKDSIATYYRDTLWNNEPFDGDIRDLCLFELSNKP